MRTIRWTLVLLAMASMLWTAGCEEESSGPSPVLQLMSGSEMDWDGTARLTCSANCPDAEKNFKQMLKSEMLLRLEQNRKWAVESRGRHDKGLLGSDEARAAAPGAEENSMEAGPAQADEGGSAEEYSDTNVQVEGVDEADFVKTDGDHIYLLSGTDLVIVDAWPPEAMQELARVEVVGYPYSFYRYDTTLVVLSSSSIEALAAPGTLEEKKNDEGYYYDYYYYYKPLTVVTVIDAADPTAPKVTGQTAFDGYMMSSRRIGGHVYLVQEEYLYELYWAMDYWPDGVDGDSSVSQINIQYKALAEQNLAFIDTLSVDDFLPKMYLLDAQGQLDPETGKAIASCQSVYTPQAYSGMGSLTVVTLDLDGVDAPVGSAVLGSWGTVYASLESLYISSTNWNWWWYYEDEDEQPEVTSHVHKFTINPESGTAKYTASGAVIGYALNQFSLDEYDGRLRIATTLPDWWWWGDDGEENQSESYVSILEDDEAGSLVTAGQVGGLGKGEQIYSVRFVKEQGYVVTFRQTDPLYVLDLSRADKPKVTGELKVPGFSSYMHPIDDSHLLTVGRDATEEGQLKGLQFQIFDVSDPANPVQTAKTVLNAENSEADWWSVWSDAMWDHHAFVYFASRKLLAIPVSGWSYDSDGWYGSYTSRLDLFKVDVEKGITPMGSVSHLDLLPSIEKKSEEDYCYYSYYSSYSWYSRVKRGIFMDDYLYSVSELGLKVHVSENLKQGAISKLQLMGQDELDELFGDYYGNYCWMEE